MGESKIPFINNKYYNIASNSSLDINLVGNKTVWLFYVTSVNNPVLEVLVNNKSNLSVNRFTVYGTPNTNIEITYVSEWVIRITNKTSTTRVITYLQH